MESQEEELEMTFDPNTIEDLGIRMYSTLPPVLAELIANAHDADASLVELQLIDSDGKKEITVKDNGDGMDFDEINKKFLRIGRKRRLEDNKKQTTPKGRKIIGKKGLGKLAFFGIAHEIKIITKKNGLKNTFIMNWDALKRADKVYKPEIVKKNESCLRKEHGTKIILRQIQRTSKFNAEDLADSIARMFIVDPGFTITIQHNTEKPINISNARRFQNLDKEIAWEVPQDIKFENSFFKSHKISGQLLSTKTPISPNLRGIILFSRKKLVNHPEFFTDSVSSHFFSYLTGWLEVDFIDDIKDDVISTNRQSLNWDHFEMAKLRAHLRNLINWLERDWRKKRAEIRDKELEKKTGIKIAEWRKHIPADINKDLDPIVSALLKDSEMAEEQTVSSLKGLQNIIKPYPYFHWRNLHITLQNSVFNYYKDENFYTAVFEGAKKYINELKRKSGESITDRDLIENVFSLTNPKLSVTNQYKKPDGNPFNTKTLSGIKEGHRMLAIAMWQAFRSPIAHEVVRDLKDSGLFTEKHCLDALSLLSHLFYRLEHSQKCVSS